jgi:hypothetical protein
VLRNTLRYMPAGAVHLAVVDPGVGGPRRAVVLGSAGGRLFVGPDNGLLVLAAEADGGLACAWQITNAKLFVKPLSATFHGRDIFAPVAAHLATGLAPTKLGPEIDPAGLVRLEIPRPRATKRGLRAATRLSSATRSSCYAAGNATWPGWRGRSSRCGPAISWCWSTATVR